MDKSVNFPSTACGMTRVRFYECKKEDNKEFEEIINHIEALGIEMLNADWSIDFTYYELSVPISQLPKEVVEKEASKIKTEESKIKFKEEAVQPNQIMKPVSPEEINLKDKEDQARIVKKIKDKLEFNILRVSEKSKREDLFLFLSKPSRRKKIESKESEAAINKTPIICNIELPKNFIDFCEITPCFKKPDEEPLNKKLMRRSMLSIRGKEYILGDHIIRFGIFDGAKKNHIIYEVEYRPLVYIKENNNKIHYKEFFDCIWEFLFGDSKMPEYYREFQKKNLDLEIFTTEFKLDQYIWSGKHSYVQMLVCLTYLKERGFHAQR